MVIITKVPGVGQSVQMVLHSSLIPLADDLIQGVGHQVFPVVTGDHGDLEASETPPGSSASCWIPYTTTDSKQDHFGSITADCEQITCWEGVCECWVGLEGEIDLRE